MTRLLVDEDGDMDCERTRVRLEGRVVPQPEAGLVPVVDAREAGTPAGTQRCAVLGASSQFRYGTAQPVQYKGLVLVTWDRGGKDWVRADRVEWLP